MVRSRNRQTLHGSTTEPVRRDFPCRLGFHAEHSYHHSPLGERRGSVRVGTAYRRDRVRLDVPHIHKWELLRMRRVAGSAFARSPHIDPKISLYISEKLEI